MRKMIQPSFIQEIVLISMFVCNCIGVQVLVSQVRYEFLLSYPPCFLRVSGLCFSYSEILFLIQKSGSYPLLHCEPLENLYESHGLSPQEKCTLVHVCKILQILSGLKPICVLLHEPQGKNLRTWVHWTRSFTLCLSREMIYFSAII